MLSAVAILSLLCVLAGAGWFSRRQISTARVQAALRALDGCAGMLQLVRSLQQHRGMSVAWLAGDASFEPQMKVRRQDIERFIAALDATVRDEEAKPRACVSHNDLVLFRFQWRELVDLLAAGAGSASVEQSLSRHGQLVAKVLDWLTALGEARIELGAAGCVEAGYVRNYVTSLPALAEHVGQARAVGAGVAARGQCAPVARVRMMFLIARIESLLRQAQAASAGSRAGREAGRLVGIMMLTARDSILDGAAGISAEDWFAEATRAIDGVYAWIDECGSELRRQLVSPAPQGRRVAAPAG